MNALCVETVPAGVVTLTQAAPAVPDGVVAEIAVALMTVRPVAAVPPMSTEVAPVNPVPIIVTVVPPATGPYVGVMLVKVGRGRGL